MLRHLGLRQRIMSIVAGGALFAIGIVALSLHELSAVQSYSEQERVAEQHREAIHEAVIVALRIAAAFASLNLDLTAEEQKSAVAEGEAMLARFEALQVEIEPVLQQILSEDDRTTLARSVVEIQRLWPEMQQEIAQNQRDEFLFHLFALVKHAERVRGIALKADETSEEWAQAAADAAQRRAWQASRMILIVLITGVIILLGLGWVVLQFGVKRPLGQAIAAVSRIANGDVASPVPAPISSDEVGSILSALAIFRDNALARLRLEEERARDMAERDARRERLEETIAEFRAAVRAALNENAMAVDSMRGAVKQLSATADDTQAGASRATAAAQEVSTNVSGVASATQQLSESSSTMIRSVEQTEMAIDQAAKRANLASTAIDGLSQSARTIDDVASFIESVASQTNLLALNATIEAARAGAAGRGFAVVASEVKSLAAQTAEATENIAARIDEMRRRTAEVVEAIRVIAKTSGEATHHAAAITAGITEQNQVTQAISKNIQDAAGWTAGLSEIVEDLAATVDHTRTAATQVQVASGASTSAADKFGRLVDGFLENVRAA